MLFISSRRQWLESRRTFSFFSTNMWQRLKQPRYTSITGDIVSQILDRYHLHLWRQKHGFFFHFCQPIFMNPIRTISTYSWCKSTFSSPTEIINYCMNELTLEFLRFFWCFYKLFQMTKFWPISNIYFLNLIRISWGARISMLEIHRNKLKGLKTLPELYRNIPFIHSSFLQRRQFQRTDSST